MLLASYRSYFENLAITHADILHVPGNEPGPGKTRFATYNVDDVMSKTLRTKVGFPAMLLELYEWNLRGHNVYDASTEYAGAFSIVDHARANTPGEEEQAWMRTEKIMQDMIQRLWFDHYGPGYEHCETPFQHLNILPSNCVPIGPVFDYEFGWRFEFTFRPKITRLLFAEPPGGTFIGDGGGGGGDCGCEDGGGTTGGRCTTITGSLNLNAPAVVVIPAGCSLNKILFSADLANTINIGKTTNGSDVEQDLAIAAKEPLSFLRPLWFTETTTLHFSGATSLVNFIILFD